MLARAALAASLMFTVQSVSAEVSKPEARDANAREVPNVSASQVKPSWQAHSCHEDDVDIVPPEAPCTGVLITIDVSTNTLYLVRDGNVVAQSSAATGTERVLKKGTTVWLFHTPRGHLRVLRKIVDPVWRKPDWAYVEVGKPVPPPNSPSRMVRNHLGRYALDLGDGILIHGTDETTSIGRKASHGCVRLPDGMLRRLWSSVPVGADVFIFESAPPMTHGNHGPEHHSDLDFR